MNGPHRSFNDKCADIATLSASMPDTHRILDRIAALLDAGELSESILLRLQPPARRERRTSGVTSGWFGEQKPGPSDHR